MPVKDIKWWLEFIYILIDRYSSSFFWCCCCCFWWLDLTLYSTRLYSIRHDSRHDMQIGYEVHAKAFVNFNSHILTSFHIFMHVFCVCFCDWGRRHRAHFPAVPFFFVVVCIGSDRFLSLSFPLLNYRNAFSVWTKFKTNSKIIFDNGELLFPI